MAWAVTCARGQVLPAVSHLPEPEAGGFYLAHEYVKGCAMSLLAIKLIVTPLVVLVASLAARRWGDAVAGWLVGLPLTSGPVSVFLALEQGPAFAAQAAKGSLAGVVSQAAFCLGYAALAARGAAAALAAGTFCYAASAVPLIDVGVSFSGWRRAA